MTATEPRPVPSPPGEGSGQASEPAPSADATAADATAADATVATAADATATTPTAPVVRSLRPEQAREDTDAAWGEYRDSNDERLYRDRPPHWADF
ncbi:MAG TPA: hypothetical protein VNV62_02275 [Trebonia sp.]|jgi:hypothetical protein|nr:hypothetical protein [Trebonia sp.]